MATKEAKTQVKKEKVLLPTSDLFAQIDSYYQEFVRCHNSDKRKDKGLGRKAVNNMKKLFTPYNQSSIAEGKVKK